MTPTVPLLDLRAQYATIRDEVLPALLDVVESQRFIMGPAVSEFEAAVGDHCGSKAAIACASGTDALLLSFLALDLRSSDEVITSPFTFFASAGAVANAGGRPRFVDIDPRTFNIDVTQVAEAVGQHTRAIEPVHLFGQMAPMEAITRIAADAGVPVIEDAAQAIGARQAIGGEWRAAGTIGLTGTLSFFPSKNLGGWGDGGMILTSDLELAERLRRLRAHGGAKQYHHDEVGTNSRLDALQAAVLLRKLAYLDKWNAERRRRAERYVAALSDIGEISCPIADPTSEHIYHQFTIRADRRDQLKEHLARHGVGTAVYYPVALHLQPCFADLGCRPGQFPEAERATKEVLSLPVFPELSDDQQDHVVEVIRAFYR